MAGEYANLKEDVQEIKASLSRLEGKLDGEHGLMVRMDRSEQFRNTVTRLFWVVAVPLNSTLILGILGFIVGVLTHRVEIIFK